MKGRPISGREKKKRYQVVLEPDVARKVAHVGLGNLSQGIALQQAINSKLVGALLKYHFALRELAGGTDAEKMRKVALKAFLSFGAALRELDDIRGL